MSLNFTVQKIEEYQGIPEGYYKAQVDHVEYIQGEYGNYHVVKWKILSPSEFEGREHQERYNVEHENDQVRHIAINNFSKFCVDIGGLKEGDEPKEDDFLFKVANILIKNRVGKKDGKSYANVVKMELLDGTVKPESQVLPSTSHDPEKTAAVLRLAGIQMPTTPVESGQPLNDEVPF